MAVCDERRRPLGSATWATLSPVALRILDRHSESAPLPELMALVAERLQTALTWRQQLALDRDAWRAIHGEADGLPGLFVDRYADAAVMQTTSVAMDAARPALAALVKRLLDVRVAVARDD